MRKLVLLAAAVAALALAGESRAAEVLLQDDEGRPIRFDVRAEGVDAEWYAALLRAAPHGDEITTVRVDVVSWTDLRSICGRNAGGCYGRGMDALVRLGSVARTYIHRRRRETASARRLRSGATAPGSASGRSAPGGQP